MFSIEEIQKILPQRYPFLMIDKVIEFQPLKKVVAVKNVSMNEGYFGGHFPGKPVMPGVLIIEAMAQGAIMLFYNNDSAEKSSQKSFYLGAVKARFMHPVFPGDQLKISIEPVKILSHSAIVDACVWVEDKEVANAQISFSVKDE